MSSCSRHASKEAVGACKNCGKLVCKLCHKEKDGLSYCQVCYDKLLPTIEAQPATSAVTAAPAVPDSSPPAKIAKADPAPMLHSVKSAEPEAQQEKSIVTTVSKGQAGISWAWWILPVVMGWIGGLISWLLNKDREPKTAQYMLFGGIGLTLLQLFMVFLIIFAAIVPGAQIPVVKLKSAAPTELNIPANSTWTATATAENGTTIQNAGISLEVPPGAVKSDTEIVVKEFAELPPEFYYAESDKPPPMAMAMSNVYDVGPAGIQFDKPVRVTIPYDKTLLPAGAKPEDIKMAYWDGKNWAAVGGYVDAQKGTVTISATNFPGSLVVPLLIVGAIVTTTGYLLSKVMPTDPRNRGTLSAHVMPDNDTVKNYTEKAGIKDANTKKWIPLEDALRPGKLNPDIMTTAGYKQIGFGGGDAKSANYPAYTEMVAGSDTNWTKPDDFFNNKDSNGNPRGDCTGVANATLSMLRRLGVEAHGVDGQLKDRRNVNGKDKDVWFEHAWTEFVYQGKPYYYDNAYGIVPLEDMKDNLSVSKISPNRGYMWDENGQKGYKDGWWKTANAPAVTIKPPGSAGDINKLYTFVARPENIPAGSKIEWYFSGGTNEKAAVYKDKETVTHEFKSGGEKTITVQYMQGNTKVAGDEVPFFVQGKASLDILLPPPASTAGLPLDPDQPNTFTAISEGVPPDAVYSWFLSGTKMDEGVNKTTLTIPAKSFKPVAEYEVSVKADWTSSDNKNKWLKASKDFFVQIKSLYIESDLPNSGGGKVCTGYTFMAKYGDKQPGTNFEWYADGEQIGSGKDSITHMFKSYGSPLVTVKATWQSNGNAQSKEATYNVQIAQPIIVVKGPKELKDHEKGIIYEYYTFWFEPENIPDGATLTMDGITISGTEESYKMLDTGIQVVTVEAKWDNDGCEGKVRGKKAFEVGEPTIDQITATPTPGTEKKQTTFKTSGKYIPKEITLVWELGKLEGSQDTTSIDTAISHTYETAGQYTVKVTLFDKSNHKWASKEMEYTVNAVPSLTVEEPYINIDANPSVGATRELAVFSLSGGNIPEGCGFSWNFGDIKKGGGYSTSSLGEPASHIYDEPGIYTVRASVLEKKTGRVLTSREISYKVVAPVITASAPVINSFKTSAGTVTSNSCTTLTWNVSGADNVEINPGSISVANIGSKKVCPTADTRYVMTASNKAGKVTSPGVSVRVIEISAPPVINSFIAGAPSCCYISWDVSGADTIIITPGSNSVAASGSQTACPTNDTTYVLTATNKAGSVSGRVFVKGTAPAPTPTPTPTPGPAPTPAPTPSTDKEEVTFAVYRELTTTWSDKTVTKEKQGCQNFLVKIYKVEGMKEVFFSPGVDGGVSIARNGLYTIILPVGHYKYKVNGSYINPDGFASGAAGFHVVKGERNVVEVVDYASYNAK